MSHVFVSYSHHDSDFVTLLRLQLEQIGISVWLDTERLDAGEEWRDAIDRAIRSAFAVIVVMTSTARKSEYVTYEWSCAWGAGVPLIPVILEPTELHPRLEAIQHFNFTDPKKRQWDKLFERVSDIAGATFTVNAPYDSPRYIREYARQLDLQHDPLEITKVIEALTNTDDPAAIEVLASATNHRNRGVRYPAALALARCSNYTDLRCIPAMLELIEKRNWKDPNLAAMAKDSYDSTNSTLISLATVGRCISEIGKLKNSRAVPALIKLIDDENKEIQRLAISALGDIGDTSVSLILVQILQNRHKDRSPYGYDFPTVYYEVVAALGKLRDPSTLESLIEALREENDLWRSEVRDTIKAFGNSAIDALASKLPDDSTAYKESRVVVPYSSDKKVEVAMSVAASNILESISTPEAIAALNAWRTSRGLSPVTANDVKPSVMLRGDDD